MFDDYLHGDGFDYHGGVSFDELYAGNSRSFSSHGGAISCTGETCGSQGPGENRNEPKAPAGTQATTSKKIPSDTVIDGDFIQQDVFQERYIQSPNQQIPETSSGVDTLETRKDSISGSGGNYNGTNNVQIDTATGNPLYTGNITYSDTIHSHDDITTGYTSSGCTTRNVAFIGAPGASLVQQSARYQTNHMMPVMDMSQYCGYMYNPRQVLVKPYQQYQSELPPTYQAVPNTTYLSSSQEFYYEEQPMPHRQLNRQSFLRSYYYFLSLTEEKQRRCEGSGPDDSSTSVYSDCYETSNKDGKQGRKTSANLYKGLFCASRECCVLLLDNMTRSPYCSKQCQVREQNMRQNRVKPRENLIRRKQTLFSIIVTLPESEFERMRISSIVNSFLQNDIEAHGSAYQ